MEETGRHRDIDNNNSTGNTGHTWLVCLPPPLRLSAIPFLPFRPFANQTPQHSSRHTLPTYLAECLRLLPHLVQHRPADLPRLVEVSVDPTHHILRLVLGIEREERGRGYKRS